MTNLEVQKLFKEIRKSSGFRVLNRNQMTMVQGLLSLNYSVDKIVTKLRSGHESRWV